MLVPCITFPAGEHLLENVDALSRRGGLVGSLDTYTCYCSTIEHSALDATALPRDALAALSTACAGR